MVALGAITEGSVHESYLVVGIRSAGIFFHRCLVFPYNLP